MYEKCLVRQPIFNAQGALVAYEIRFRDGDDGTSALVQSLVSGTFDMVRGGLPAFVMCTREQLLDNTLAEADPKATILLVPPNVGADDEVQAALEARRTAGGLLALDDLTEAPSASEAFAHLMDWARIDLRCDSADLITQIADRVSNGKIRLLADHVDDAEQYAMAREIGFDAFAGTYFNRPEPVKATELPSSSVAAMRLLGLARDQKVSDRELEDTISIDAVLTFQLLRLVNSAAVGARGVTSIGHALRLIGRNAFLKWLSMAIAGSRGAKTGVDQHLVRQAVERGRLLEQLAGRNRDGGTLFLVGLFSLLDTVFRMPLPDIVARVALGDEAKAALLKREGPYALALEFAEAYELGLFESATQLAEQMGVKADTLPDLYTTAIVWTNEALAPMLGSSPAPAVATAGRR